MPNNSPYADLKSEGSSPSPGQRSKKPLIAVVIVLVVAAALAVAIFAVRGGIGVSEGSGVVTGAETGSVIEDASQLEAGQIAVSVEVDGTEGGGELWFSGLVAIGEGGSAFDALEATGQQVSSKSSLGMGKYVSGINGLMEKDLGSQSGWLFYVNGVEASVSSDDYALSDGDSVTWVYRIDALDD